MQNNKLFPNFSTDNVFNFKGNSEDIIPPIPLSDFVINNASEKTVDNSGNYWIE